MNRKRARAHGRPRQVSEERAVRLPTSLAERLERMAAANARSLEAEASFVLGEHVSQWEERERLASGTTGLNNSSRSFKARRAQAEAADLERVAELKRRRIENVRRLQNWVEICEPEERRRGVIYDPATGESWYPYRGIVFEADQADPCPFDPIAPRAFYIQDGEVIALEPTGPRVAVGS